MAQWQSPASGGGEIVGEMFTVYILKNTITGRRYIGSTKDFNRRLAEHNSGHTKSTATKGQWNLIYSEIYENEIQARRRERQIKSYKEGNALIKLLSRDGSVAERVIGND